MRRTLNRSTQNRPILKKGQAIVLVLVALSLFLIAGLGLAIDASHLYAQRQMAQAAADAAARAAIMSVFGKTNSGPSNPITNRCPANVSGFCKNDFGPANFVCDGSNPNITPCFFAAQNGFSAANGDTVDVTFPTSVPGVTLSPSWTPGPGASPAAVQVTVFRNVNTTLMRLLGPASSKIAAQATAGIVQVFAPVPILVLHPFLPSFVRGGSGGIQICGGPAQSIQVNSTAALGCSGSTCAVNDNGGGTIDLSKAGPDATKTGGIPNCDGTGADFGVRGGPPTNYPGNLSLGTKPGQYRQPYGPIYDPLATVPTPSAPIIVNPPPLPVANGSPLGCPAVTAKPCVLYQPGLYNGGITVANNYALFAPGLYYMNGGGFHGGSNSTMKMANCPVSGLPAGYNTASLTDFTCANGLGSMLVYNKGNGNNDVFEVGSNGDAALIGSDFSGTYKAILFFEDHTSAGHTGTSGGHKLGGGGNLSLTGTIYLTDTNQTNATYQELVLRGNSGNLTNIIGEIIVDALDIGGGGQITMILDPDALLPVDQVALIK